MRLLCWMIPLCAMMLTTASLGQTGVTAEPQLVAIGLRSSHDGKAINGWLQLPPGYTASTPAPLLVWAQGMYRGAKWAFGDVGDAPARRGWLVLAIDLRGDRIDREHPGVTSNDREPEWDSSAANLGGARGQRDVIDALDYVLDHYGVDRQRIYLGGSSMAGLTAGLMLANYPDCWAAGVLTMPVTDLADWYHELDPEAIHRQDMVIECGGTLEERPAEYARRSLLASAQRLARVPLFICHGRDDTIVPPSHTEKLVQAILAHKPSDLYVHFFDGGHQREKIDIEKACDFLARFSRP